MRDVEARNQIAALEERITAIARGVGERLDVALGMMEEVRKSTQDVLGRLEDVGREVAVSHAEHTAVVRQFEAINKTISAHADALSTIGTIGQMLAEISPAGASQTK